jgi:hydroxymethylglutaryl-CoA lyase
VQFPKRINIVDVSPRDGFQSERDFIPTELKIDIINSIARAGVRKIEATSFMSPKAVPQLADAAEVMAGIERRSGTQYTAMVGNLKGVERAIEAQVDGVRLVVTSTETYNLKNVGMSVDDSLEVCRQIIALAEGAGIAVEAIIGVAFGCPFEGRVPEARVVELAHRFADMGVHELSVADSMGLGNPAQIGGTMARLHAELDGLALSLHIHDTRGLGFANVLAGMDAGVMTYDSSIGGLGGCPVIPNAAGNIGTEDLANMCHEMGIETGVDIEAIQRISRRMEEFLERRLPSRVLAAGTPDQLYSKIDQESD